MTNVAAASAQSARMVTPAPEIEIPELPRLAAGVRLHGEMTETAYKNPPFLVERDGAYFPVSRLLHAVAECADGKTSLNGMAERVSDFVERHVTASDIRILVAGLIRSGIVEGPPGSTSAVTTPAASGPSPLTVNMRMRMFSPGVIDGVSRLLRVLFWPPIVLITLALVAAAQVWMYFIHGIGGSLHEALYAPGFVLVVLGAIVVAAGFHEFGHASALRYAGGRAKQMGVGFYLFYPAFYTDVTDNYRLSRLARLRTDLGGFYFHAIFALGAIGAYLAVGWEPLLLIVVLINLEIIHQLMPFVRLDGYWTLADMTGIPDFFSHMGPFLRSLVPLPFLKGGKKAPELKTWAKVVFVLYILVTIPVLLFVLVHLVLGLPRVLGTAWDSLGQQWIGMTDALAAGQGLTVASSAVQILVLVLMTGGLLFFLFNLGRMAVRRAWDWSRPTWPRRAVGALATVGLAGVLVFLFAPASPLTGDDGGPFAGAINFAPIGKDESLTWGDLSKGLFGEPSSAPDGSGSDEQPGATDGAAPADAAPGPAQTASAATPTPAAGSTTAPAAPTTTPQPTATPQAAGSQVATSTPGPTPTPTPAPTPAPTLAPTPAPTPASSATP